MPMENRSKIGYRMRKKGGYMEHVFGTRET